MSTFVMMVGLPCSGKSTYVYDNLYPLTISSKGIIVSSDDIIANIAQTYGFTYDEIFNDTVGMAQKLVFKRVEKAIHKNINIIWDQTNLTKKSRKSKLKMIPSGYVKKCVVVTCPFDTILERNKIRSQEGKTIPEEVFKKMYDELEMPSDDEGFDSIEFINKRKEN